MKLNSKQEAFAKVFLADGSSQPGQETSAATDSGYEQLRRTLYEFGESARSATERPNEFWCRQRAVIWSRIPAEGKQAVNRTVVGWAGVAALVILGIALLSGGPAPPPAPVASQVDADHDLLVAVERDVQSEVPDALQPAALLAKEMNDGMQSHSVNPRSPKEKANED